MLPLVKLAGSPENFRDGQFMIWLAGLGPALLFLVLEKLRRTGRSSRSEVENVLLSGLFAFGTVYFFTAVEGTVWFAAHVVGVVLVGGYLLTALDAERPLLAGLLLGCSFATRPVTSMLAVLFALEAFRVSAGGRSRQGRRGPSASTLRGRRSTSARSPAGTRRSQRQSSSSWQSAPGPTTRASTPGARRTSATST